MNQSINPFHDLWLTEILKPEDFVQMFSPKIVNYSKDLFGTGNVVVRGRQGSGKSMLLRLLDTRTRIAYALSEERNPVPENHSFICGSVNLTRANISAMSSRLSCPPEDDERAWAAATFSDILNYNLALNLLQDLIFLDSEQKRNSSLNSILNICLNEGAQERFCDDLNSDDIWYGSFQNCKNFGELISVIQQRLDQYRSYFNYNVESLNKDVIQTRTEIGEPVSKLAESLRASGIIPKDCLVYLKIDQHEELLELEKETGLDDVFRQIINKALAGRDHRSAYRIGTRHYSWSEKIKIWGTSAHLEDIRDYLVVDIDEFYRRKENPSIGDRAFREFAQDVFRRRMHAAGYVFKSKNGPIDEVFGESPTAYERAKGFTRPPQSFPKHWDEKWKIFLTSLRKVEPLDSKLMEAWLGQKAQDRICLKFDKSIAESMPWKERGWWKKERYEAALLQLASENSQNLFWYGTDHIILLSGGNILAFMSICRTIWSGWLRQSIEDMDGHSITEDIAAPKIDVNIQIIGIYEASKLWVDKLGEGQDGSLRKDLIFKLASWFRRTLKDDRALSYPGHNGFSFLRTEFEYKDPINHIIRRCRDYGDLVESRHTSKNKKGGQRVKWYLNPILCPYFDLPHIRTKEPIYISLLELGKILAGAGQKVRKTKSSTPDLFDQL